MKFMPRLFPRDKYAPKRLAERAAARADNRYVGYYAYL